MNLYAVRLHHGQQPIGFFWADDVETLSWMVEDLAKPSQCEYRVIHEPACVIWGWDESEPNWRMGVDQGVDPNERTDSSSKHFENVRRGLRFGCAKDKGNELYRYLNGSADVAGWRLLPRGAVENYG